MPAPQNLACSRLIGVTVLPEYIQFEGIDRVLDNLQSRAGVTAVATSPYVMEMADEQTGSREPPIDAGAGKVRLLDRPLWGKRELWMRTAPSFEPNTWLYEGLRYRPAEPDHLTDEFGHIVFDFLDAAKKRGLATYLQVQSAIPPGYRVQFGGPEEEDLPRLPDGRVPQNRVANNGSLASPHIVDYHVALLKDLCETYPQIDGIRVDWPEYPPYRLDSVFVDFCDFAHDAADELDFNFELMRKDTQQLYDFLHHGLTNEHLRSYLADPSKFSLETLLGAFPGFVELGKFKAQLSLRLLQRFRNAIDEVSPRVKLAPAAFPPPWSSVSGMDLSVTNSPCSEFAVKLYAMHWAMMLNFYGEQILGANKSLDESLLVAAMLSLLEIEKDAESPTLQQYRYPDPDQPHPGNDALQVQKIRDAQEAAGDTPVHVLAHGYGPLEDVRRRIRIA
ncbi:MAG: hypothetical protein ACI9G1_005617, partial [Pirellulaceae bacterium]